MGRARLDAHREFYAQAGKMIAAARTERKVTQEKLASRVSLTRTSIINIEKGRQQLLAHTLVDIAHALDVAPQDLLPDLPTNERESRVKQALAGESRKVREFLEGGWRKVKTES